MKGRIAVLITSLLLLSAGLDAGGQTLKFDTFGAYEQPLLGSPQPLTSGVAEPVTVVIDQAAMQVSITYEDVNYEQVFLVKSFNRNVIKLQDGSHLRFTRGDLDVGLAHYSRADRTWSVFSNVQINPETNLAMLELQADGIVDYDLLE